MVSDDPMGPTTVGTGRQEPAGVSDDVVQAVGTLTEAFEIVERARGMLYGFHQLTGSADFTIEQATTQLRQAGHDDLARRLNEELLGRNVLRGRWTYQLVEEYDDDYYAVFQDFLREARDLTDGQRHAFEARLKRQRRTRGQPGHDAEPNEPACGDRA